MNNKQIPPILIKLESLRYQLSGDSRKEYRYNKLLQAIKHLYTSGWYHSEVVAFFENKNLYSSEAQKIATYVFTRDMRLNPFGYWYEFNYLLPIQVLFFTSKKLKLNSVPTAGFIFTLLLFDQNKKSVNDQLTSAIESHRDNLIIEKLTSFRTKSDLIYIDSPATFLQISSNSNNTRNNVVRKINDALNIEMEIYFEHYGFGDSIKTRMWISNYAGLITQFEQFKKEIKADSKEFLNRSLERIEAGGVSIFDIDEELLKNHDLLMGLNNTILRQKKSGEKVSQYYRNCIKSKSGKPLKRMFNSYEKLFMFDRYTYLDHLPVKSNPFIRIFKSKKEYLLMCQKSFIGYKLLLLTLYGTSEQILATLPKRFSISDKTIKLIREATSSEILKEVAMVRFNLIVQNIGNHLHPISNKTNILDKGKHHHQIAESIDVVNSMNRAGVKINVELTEYLLNELRRRQIDPEYRPFSDSDRFSDRSNGLDFHSIKTDPESIKLYVGWLSKMLGSARSLKSTGSQRIFGMFSTHGAKTHRMVSRRINIQGIPKLFKKSLFIPESNKILLSADIAGQDIAITLNIAYKMSLDRSLKASRAFASLDILKKDISSTIMKLRLNSKYSLINTVKERVEANGWTDSYFYRGENYCETELRDVIKTFVYTAFYGGSPRNLVKASMQSQFRNIIDLRDAFLNESHELHEDDLVLIKKLLNKFHPKMSFKDLSVQYERLLELFEDYLRRTGTIGSKTIESFENCIYNIGVEKQLYQEIESSFKEEYPGLLEVFDVLHEYAETHQDNLTYPTILGWQTVVDSAHPRRGDYLSTRSKAYVVQASGAEFMRQWLIELSKTTFYRRNKFKIIAAIHDRVIIETTPELEKELKAILQETKDKACEVIGIFKETMKIPKIEKIAPP